MPRKKTKVEALEDLVELRRNVAAPSSKLPRRAQMVRDAAFLGAAGLIMLDPLNRLADERIVLPLDMVCIPAYQAYMIQGSPSLQIYVRAGETIVPTGGNVEDVRQALEDESLKDNVFPMGKPVPLQKPNAYQKRYKKAFNQLKPRYCKKDGTWRKGGFKRCVKEAHAQAAKGGK